jgi:hypothetical protein
MAEGTVELLTLGATGASLRISASRRQMVGIIEDPWFDASISVDAYPFAGTIDTIFTLSDLKEWAESMRSIDELPHRAVLGGNRAAEVLIDIERQIGGLEGALALEVSVTPSGDDPNPYLRFLIFDVTPFWDEAAARIDGLD